MSNRILIVRKLKEQW